MSAVAYPSAAEPRRPRLGVARTQRLYVGTAVLIACLRGLIAAAASGVLLWRIAAYWSPAFFIDIPDSLRLPLTLLGLVFVVAGVWAWWARPSRWTNIFLLGADHMGTANATRSAVY